MTAGVLGAVAGSTAYILFCRPYVTKRFRRNMADRGLAVRFRQAMRLSDEKISVETGAITRSAEWAAVTEVFKAKSYWVFLVQMEPWFAPVRFFPDEASEKAFIRAAISHMSPAARERSKAAVRYAEG
jgi:hypothetical protein